ncbi:hypothetical protein [Streptomyces sp. NPDC004783]|uniref:hypothetical protein n=1 Tax=Streptomyces sp. NPDC004783 TaxID=3154459 RepID=UPI0033A21BEF
MNTSSLRRRSVLGTLAVAAAVVLGVAGTPAVAVSPQSETYTLTIKHLDRAGRATGAYETTVTGLSGAGADEVVRPHDTDGTTTVQLPRGRYVLDSAVTGSADGGTDWIVQPRLDLDRDTTITVDARTARPVDVRPPDDSARFLHSAMFVKVTHGGAERLLNRIVAAPTLRVAHLGPTAEPDSVKQWYDAYWEGATADYGLGRTVTGDRALTGLTLRPAPKELATLKVRATRTGFLDVQPTTGPTVGLSRQLTPSDTATYLVTPERGTWDVSYSADGQRYSANELALRAGSTTVLTFPDDVV